MAIETTEGAAALEWDEVDAGAGVVDRWWNKEADWHWASPCPRRTPAAFAAAVVVVVVALVAATVDCR